MIPFVPVEFVADAGPDQAPPTPVEIDESDTLVQELTRPSISTPPDLQPMAVDLKVLDAHILSIIDEKLKERRAPEYWQGRMDADEIRAEAERKLVAEMECHSKSVELVDELRAELRLVKSSLNACERKLEEAQGRLNTDQLAPNTVQWRKLLDKERSDHFITKSKLQASLDLHEALGGLRR